jgi:acetyltransferase-like isoleucine patch superfamily enzyme
MNRRSLLKVLSLDMYKTLKYSNNKMLNLRVSKYTSMNLKRSSNLIIEGKLKLGYFPGGKSKPWHNTTLQMGEKSELEVSGDFTIYYNGYINIGENAILRLGSGYCNIGTTIQCSNKIVIGDDVCIAPGVSIQDYDEHVVVKEGYELSKPIMIGNHVWIGKNAMILKGVTIGDNVIIAARAVVTKDIPPNTMVGGVPARVIEEGVTWY